MARVPSNPRLRNYSHILIATKQEFIKRNMIKNNNKKRDKEIVLEFEYQMMNESK